MLVTTELPRVFTFTNKGQTIPLADIPSLSPQAVMNFYSNTYPELTTSKMSGPTINNDAVEYKFESVMGTKG